MGTALVHFNTTVENFNSPSDLGEKNQVPFWEAPDGGARGPHLSQGFLGVPAANVS